MVRKKREQNCFVLFASTTFLKYILGRVEFWSKKGQRLGWMKKRDHWLFKR